LRCGHGAGKCRGHHFRGAEALEATAAELRQHAPGIEVRCVPLSAVPMPGENLLLDGGAYPGTF